MKIAYLTGEYPRATDTFIQREVAGLRALEHEVLTCSIRRTGASHHVGVEQREEAARTFYVLAKTKNPFFLFWDHLTLIATNPRRYWGSFRLALSSGSPGIRGRLIQLAYFAEAAVLARKLLKSGVTHLHNHIATSSASVAMITSEMSGIPFSMTVHGPDIFFEPKRWRLDLKVAKARFVACISHYCRSQVMISTTPHDWQKLHIVHCGIEPERYSRAPDIQGNRVLFVGRLAAVKGVPLLLEAAALLRADGVDLHVDLVGDGPDRGALERQAKELDISDATTFHGYRSQSEVADFLSKAAVFALPSFAEGLPVVLMEALASGCPAVATRIAGIPELVLHEETGLICDPGDVAALVHSIRRAISNRDQTKGWVKRGAEIVAAEFNSKTEAQRLAQLFEAYGAGQNAQLPIRPEVTR